MKVCIVGTGASGWLCCNYLKHQPFVDEVTIIGSSKIPTIGVGESTTLEVEKLLRFFVQQGDFEFSDFIRESHATIKYGVMYENWSKHTFIHHFKSLKHWKSDRDYLEYGQSLLNKDPNTNIHEYIGSHLLEFILENKISLDDQDYPTAFHFDAAQFIKFMSGVALKHPKVKFIDGIVRGGNIKDDEVNSITVNGKNVESDYFIFATGDNKLNVDFLGIEYTSLDKYLLTNKAVVYPLKFQNKREQIHPYTVAKTMDNGWRWITPIWTRIGTGYVFSNNHISEDEAVHEFLTDIGDHTLTPNVVDFYPKYNKRCFRKNWCTIGMSQGFLEPLDAPGLTITAQTIVEYLHNAIQYKNIVSNYNYMINEYNSLIEKKHLLWMSFILCQYKTSHRDHTQFWKDHKNVQCEYYDNLISSINDVKDDSNAAFMFYQTIAAKGHNIPVSNNNKPKKSQDTFIHEKIHHQDFIGGFHFQI